MKVFPVIWNYSVKYAHHIIMIGTFYAECAYMKMIGHKMNGSGFEDVLMEAGLITSGSWNGVMMVKDYE